MKSNQFLFVGVCSLGTCISVGMWGCAAQPKNNPDASYSEIKKTELSSERREFINDTHSKLKDVDRDLGLTQAKLDHESNFVTAEQRAEWSQEIFDLKQQRQRLTAELKRAETVSESEWKEMRGPIGVSLDSLQAGATKVGNTVAQAFQKSPEPAATGGLCSLDVGKTEAKVAEQSKNVVVDVTVNDPKSVDELRTKAAELARNTTQYSPMAEAQASEGQTPTSAKPAIPVVLATQNIESGVRVTFKPKTQQTAALQERLNYDAKILREDRCASNSDPALASAK